MTAVAGAPIVVNERDHWINDLERSACRGCGTSFGLFTRRHHCRMCRDVFCDGCSDLRSRAIPTVRYADPSAPPSGDARPALRVCKGCYYSQLAYLVVYYSTFATKHKTFGDREEADAFFQTQVPDTNKLLMRMNDRRVMRSAFADAATGRKMVDEAVGICAKYQGGAATVSGALAATAPVASPAAIAHVLAAAGGLQSPFRRTLVCLVIDVEGVLFTEWQQDPRPHVHDTDTLRAMLGARHGAIVSPGREVLVANAGRTFGLFTRDTAEVEQRCLQEFDATPYLVVWHGDEGCAHRKFASLPEARAYTDRMDSDAPWLVMHPSGELIEINNVFQRTFLKQMRTYAGQNALREFFGEIASLRSGVVAVVESGIATPLSSAAAVTTFSSPSIRLMRNLADARDALNRSISAEAFLLARDERVAASSSPAAKWRMIATKPSGSWRAVLSPSVVAEIDAKLEVLVQAAKSADQRPDGEAPITPSSAAGGPASGGGMRAPAIDIPSCCICFSEYEGSGSLRPVFCHACGNCVCLACRERLTACPTCRDSFVGARRAFNVELMALLDAIRAASA